MIKFCLREILSSIPIFPATASAIKLYLSKHQSTTSSTDSSRNISTWSWWTTSYVFDFLLNFSLDSPDNRQFILSLLYYSGIKLVLQLLYDLIFLGNLWLKYDDLLGHFFIINYELGEMRW